MTIRLIKGKDVELTHEEVLERINDGQIFDAIDSKWQILSVEKDKGLVKYELNINSSTLVINPAMRFKLRVPKKLITVYQVQHQKDGKEYSFVSSQLLVDGAWVVCDTTMGKSYGRVIKTCVTELTELEISKIKECWRAE